MKTPNTICADKEPLKEELTQFAIAVNREVCMRIGGFKPANESEFGNSARVCARLGSWELLQPAA